MSDTNKHDEVKIHVLNSITEIDADTWNAFANPLAQSQGTVWAQKAEWDYNPFLSYAFLSALEEAGCANTESGWHAQHLMLESMSGETLGFLPCYLKNHSQGEYVFDHGWADAFERAGGNYYPKLQTSIPFTPATGRRLLVKPDDAELTRPLLATGLEQLCRQLPVSSAHITFMEETEWLALQASGTHFLHRNDQQFHFHNEGYETFDDFLQTLASRKRKAIRKERAAALATEGISIEWLTGDDLTEAVWDRFFLFYMDTGARKWGRPYLNRKFFSLISETLAEDIVLIMAKRNGEYVAGAINFIGENTVFGRHWGCTENHPFLHFEICYYQAIDWAIAHKKSLVEAGAQGAHKLARGYMPTITHSAHHISHPGFREAIADYLRREREAVEFETNAIAKHGPFKKSNSAANTGTKE